MPVRHNIDVMHVEKNISDAILSLLMQSVKSKDGLKARLDLEDMGIRSNLHTQVRGKRKYLPPAAYWLSKIEKKIFCKRLAEFRGPDGYCANIGNCVSVDPPAIGGLKSHDHHVLLQNLLPVALRGTLPRGPRIVVNRMCNFFNRLCQRVIDPEKLISLEAESLRHCANLKGFFLHLCLISCSTFLYILQERHVWEVQFTSGGCILLKGTLLCDYNYNLTFDLFY